MSVEEIKAMYTQRLNKERGMGTRNEAGCAIALGCFVLLRSCAMRLFEQYNPVKRIYSTHFATGSLFGASTLADTRSLQLLISWRQKRCFSHNPQPSTKNSIACLGVPLSSPRPTIATSHDNASSARLFLPPHFSLTSAFSVSFPSAKSRNDSIARYACGPYNPEAKYMHYKKRVQLEFILTDLASLCF